MGLKFRRGTTAQKSGSLAFGEPYVNTTLGTLQIGGATGDITLGSTGTGSTGNFGAISGSGLDITGNANIAGNLTLGGQLTIGDATSDTVNVVASLSSSLIPLASNVFDLGSPTKYWRDLFISTGSIKFVGAGGAIVGTLSNSGNGLSLDAGVIARGDSSFGTSSLSTTSVTGSLNVLGTINLVGNHNVSGSVTATSIIGEIAATNGVISGSSQLTSSLDDRYVLESETGSLQSSVNNLSQSVYDTLYFPTTGLVAGISASVSQSTEAASQSLYNELYSPITTAFGYTLNKQLYGDFSTTGSFASSSYALSSSFYTTLYGDGMGMTGLSGSVAIDIYNVSSSLNVVSSSLSGFSSSVYGFSGLSASFDTRISTEKDRVDAILLAADADKDSFAEIVTLINSVDTTNDNAFASFYTASVGRLNNLELTSGSVNVSVSNLNTFSGSQLTKDSTLASYTASVDSRFTTLGTYTGSNDTTNTTQNTRLTALEASASTALSTNNTQDTKFTTLATYTGSNDTTNTTQNTRLDQLSTASGSAITRLTALEGFTSSINTTIKTRLNAETVISGSSQVFSNVSGDVTIASNGVATIAADSVALGTDTTGNYVASLVAGTNITLTNNTGENATPTIGLTNNTISGIALGSNLATLTIGTGLSGTSYNGSGAVTIANTGVTSAVAGTAISVSGGTGAVTINNTGVTSNVAGTGVSVSGATGAVTISIGQSVATSANAQFNSLGIGMAASATAGRIDATNDVVAFSSSDIRFKENITPIENALDKISKIGGYTYDWKAENKIEHGYEGNDVGVIAQEIEVVLPQLVQNRDNGYKAVKYDKLVALLIEGIKEQQKQIDSLTIQVEALKK